MPGNPYEASVEVQGGTGKGDVFVAEASNAPEIVTGNKMCTFCVKVKIKLEVFNFWRDIFSGKRKKSPAFDLVA